MTRVRSTVIDLQVNASTERPGFKRQCNGIRHPTRLVRNGLTHNRNGMSPNGTKLRTMPPVS
ncbi:MAG: hypothetical protein JWQ82_1350, partial [Tardiphaga sp.]|nr:hypothetical protein [Tardiphaga sp.]